MTNTSFSAVPVFKFGAYRVPLISKIRRGGDKRDIVKDRRDIMRREKEKDKIIQNRALG